MVTSSLLQCMPWSSAHFRANTAVLPLTGSSELLPHQNLLSPQQTAPPPKVTPPPPGAHANDWLMCGYKTSPLTLVETIRKHHPTASAPYKMAVASVTAALWVGLSLRPGGLLSSLCVSPMNTYSPASHTTCFGVWFQET